MSAGADIMCRLMNLIFYLFDNNSWMLSSNNIFKLWTALVFFSSSLFVCCSSTHFTHIIQRNKTCLYSDKELGFEDQEGGNSPREQEKTLRPGLIRSTSREISRIPLQVAGSEKSPSDLVCRRRWRMGMLRTTSTLFEGSTSETLFDLWAGGWLRTWNKYQPCLFRKDLEDFQRTHIIAATREVRPDIVRALFQYMKVGDLSYSLDKKNLIGEPGLGDILRLSQLKVC